MHNYRKFGENPVPRTRKRNLEKAKRRGKKGGISVRAGKTPTKRTAVLPARGRGGARISTETRTTELPPRRGSGAKNVSSKHRTQKSWTGQSGATVQVAPDRPRLRPGGDRQDEIYASKYIMVSVSTLLLDAAYIWRSAYNCVLSPANG